MASSWVTPRTWVTSEVPPATTWNIHVRDNLSWLGTDKPSARVFNSAAQTVTNATQTVVTFDSERFDAAGMHSTVTNTGRLTVPTGMGGKYLIGAQLALTASGTQGYVAIRLNGTTLIARSNVTTNNYLNVVTFYQLAAADYVEMIAFQNSGGSTTSAVDAGSNPEFWIKWDAT